MCSVRYLTCCFLVEWVVGIFYLLTCCFQKHTIIIIPHAEHVKSPCGTLYEKREFDRVLRQTRSGTRHLQFGDTVAPQPLRWTLLRRGIISKRLLRMTFSVEATSTRTSPFVSEPYGKKRRSLTPEAFPKTTFIPEWQRRGCFQWNGIQRRALSRYCPMCRQATTKT
jgi:hypothetical protein